MALAQHTLPIVGIAYPNKRGPTRIFELQVCQPGEVLELRPEPDNEFDPYALAVYSCRGIQLGYVPAERCARLTSMLLNGREVRAAYQGRDRIRGYMRIAYDGDTPVIPATKPEVQPEQDFWPDPVWDD